jgi:hypothetical protein
MSSSPPPSFPSAYTFATVPSSGHPSHHVSSSAATSTSTSTSTLNPFVTPFLRAGVSSSGPATDLPSWLHSVHPQHPPMTSSCRLLFVARARCTRSSPHPLHARKRARHRWLSPSSQRRLLPGHRLQASWPHRGMLLLVRNPKRSILKVLCSRLCSRMWMDGSGRSARGNASR